MRTDEAGSPVATWFQWQLQQTGRDEKEALHSFLTVQVANDGDRPDGDMPLAQMRMWLQVCGVELDALHYTAYGMS